MTAFSILTVQMVSFQSCITSGCFLRARIYDVHTLYSSNLYQIFTYVKNKEAEFGTKAHQVSGMLLYAATDEAIQPDNSYQMSGNQISVKTLGLNRDFSEIAAQFNAIVDKHFG